METIPRRQFDLLRCERRSGRSELAGVWTTTPAREMRRETCRRGRRKDGRCSGDRDWPASLPDTKGPCDPAAPGINHGLAKSTTSGALRIRPTNGSGSVSSTTSKCWDLRCGARLNASTAARSPGRTNGFLAGSSVHGFCIAEFCYGSFCPRAGVSPSRCAAARVWLNAEG